MYNFIFYVLYEANIEDGKFTARFQATLVTFFALFIHLALIMAICKRVLISREAFDSSGIADWFNKNKGMYVLVTVALIGFVYKYYNNRRIENLLEKYGAISRPTKKSSVLKILLIILLPIILAAIILTINLE